MSDETNIEFEAAAFRKLISHLQSRTDVQNIDMMNLTGFCRNCLSRWYQEAANNAGQTVSVENARELIYGMPYETWRKIHQTTATKEQLATYKDTQTYHE